MAYWLICGLGNPGEQYEKTRHNVGFMVLDAAASKFQASSFKFQANLNAQVSEGILDDQNIVLAKPQTFMNSSGDAVKNIYTKYQIPDTKYIIVVHDDIDLPVGTIRISQASGSAGHKGVQSIIDQLGTNEFARIRVGILPERGKSEDVENFVLKKFSKNEWPLIEAAIQNASSAIETILSAGLEPAMQQWN